jgi:hypothetical protein
MQNLDNKRLLTRALSILAEKLPADWTVKVVGNGGAKSEPSAQIRISASRGAEATVNAVLKQSMQPIDAIGVKDAAAAISTKNRRAVLVVSPFISPSTRKKLREHGFGYLDFCGNICFKIDVPALYIETEGAQKNPTKIDRQARTLKGAKAGLIVRTLADTAAVPGVRDLAKRLGIDPGYVSRVFAFLKDEAIIRHEFQIGAPGKSRTSKRQVEWSVDWVSLIRRWALEAPLENRSRVFTYIEPRGLKAALSNLAGASFQYAITGSCAAAELAPIAPPRLLQIYVEDAEKTAKQLGLREADTGGNVVLIEAENELPFLRSRQERDLNFASVSQVVADLLSSPGRAPAEAEELFNWMKNNEEVWRG